ncbi:MAG TPA: class I SAM-dependent methyltransferase [Solirubrobacteraceae bacterium]|nr:class I SAM-dependent methyltransferase [Solirubrobacteraceae bacterium]
MSALRENASSEAGDGDSRLRFGSVAEQYDRARPGYPEGLIDAAFAYGDIFPGERALDVGTGTGQLATAVAARGLEVLGVEPSAAMAEIANQKFAAAGLEAHAIVGEFESVALEPGAFSLICAGTSWHWLDEDTRFDVAARAIAPGGTLAVLWTWPHWRRTGVCAELDAAYARSGAPLEQMGPMCPLEPDSGALAREWLRHTQESGVFGDAQGKLCSWSVTYTACGYTDLLGTYADHIGLEPAVRERLFCGIEQIIDEAGGTIELPYTTLLLLARAA